MAEFIESHIRALYNLLGHKSYYSRIGSLDFTKKEVRNGKEVYLYREELVQGIDEVLKYAKEYNGKRNIFIGRCPRSADNVPLINKCRVISFDIDPVRPKGEASTNEQHQQALNAGRKLIELYPNGFLSSSGNGALVIYAVLLDTLSMDKYYDREGTFIDELNKQLGQQYNVRIDHTNYAQAVIKLIGTFSTKGTNELRRCSRFIQVPIPPYPIGTGLLKRLNDIEPTKSVVVKGVDLESIRSKFNGDRSIADYQLVNFLHKSGVGPEIALQALQTNPIGRQTDEKDQARLISKIYGESKVNEGIKKVSYFTSLFEQNSTASSAIVTGFSSLDRALGPLPKGEITTFAARSGFGKTTFGCTVAESLRNNGKRVIYFSTEMSTEYIMHKLVAIARDIPLEKLVSRQLDGLQDTINSYRDSFNSFPIRICDDFSPTIEKVKLEAEAYQPDVIIFDHITQSGTHWEHIAQFTRAIKSLTAELGCVTLLLSQLNEPPRKSDGTVMQSIRGDIRGSQEIIFLSAIFMMLNNPYEVKTDIQPVQITIAKNRYGISGHTVDMVVNKRLSKFMEKE